MREHDLQPAIYRLFVVEHCFLLQQVRKAAAKIGDKLDRVEMLQRAKLIAEKQALQRESLVRCSYVCIEVAQVVCIHPDADAGDAAHVACMRVCMSSYQESWLGALRCCHSAQHS